MIHFNDTDMFSIKVIIGGDDLALVNFMVDPIFHKLKKYQDSPICSIFIRSTEFVEWVKSNMGTSERPANSINLDPQLSYHLVWTYKQDIAFEKQRINDAVINTIMSFSQDNGEEEINVYNGERFTMMRDELLDKLELDPTEAYKEIRFSRVLYYIDTTIEENVTSFRNILIGGVVITGTMKPIPKSPNYNLVNAVFAPTVSEEKLPSYITTKPHTPKLFLFVVDIKISFIFYELSQVSGDNTFGNIITYAFFPKKLAIQCEVFKSDVFIEGREELFRKIPGPLFHVSNIPDGVTVGDDIVRNL